MPEYPKFKQKLLDTVIDPAIGQSANTNFGIILTYDKATNSASIVLAQNGSNAPGEMFVNVPCPIVNGVQVVSPTPGKPCIVAFRSGSQTEPYITHFFDYNYATYDYNQQYHANNEIPQFLGLL